MSVEESKILLGVRRWVAYDGKHIAGVYDSENEANTELNLYILKKRIKDGKYPKSESD